MWEIGLVMWYDGHASKIVGPFKTRQEAINECTKRNIEEKRKCPPGHGQLGWMCANWGEIPREPDCEITTTN